jgi:hypothetical protein
MLPRSLAKPALSEAEGLGKTPHSNRQGVGLNPLDDGSTAPLLKA